MLSGDIGVAEPLGFVEGPGEHALETRPGVDLDPSVDLGEPVEHAIDLRPERCRLSPELLQKGIDDALGLGEQGPQQMGGLDLLMVEAARQLLSRRQSLLRLHGQSVDIHSGTSSSRS